MNQTGKTAATKRVLGAVALAGLCLAGAVDAWPRFRLPQPAAFAQGGPNQTLTFGRAAYDTALVLARARFEVKDPAQIKACNLSLDYWGGVIVYVNGKELIRGDLPAGQVEGNTAAKEYPDDAFCGPDGKLMRNDDEKNADRHALRNRKLHDVQVPAAMLQKGMNVIAIEAHQAPVSVKADKGIG